MLKWLLIFVGVSLLLLSCHKLFLWMEERGWIYYHKKKAKPGTSANALLEIHSLMEPAKKHVMHVVQEEYEEDDGEAGPGNPNELKSRM